MSYEAYNYMINRKPDPKPKRKFPWFMCIMLAVLLFMAYEYHRAVDASVKRNEKGIQDTIILQKTDTVYRVPPYGPKGYPYK